MHEPPIIPMRRSNAKVHLQRGAQCELGSDEERYCLQAAIAESLLHIAEELRQIRIGAGIPPARPTIGDTDA